MAYEMRISDWSSDVCSSDLVMGRFGLGYEDVKKTNPKVVYLSVTGFGQSGPNSKLPTPDSVIQAYSVWMTLDRKRVVSGKSVSVRVDLCGRRIIKKKHRLQHVSTQHASMTTHYYHP